MAKVKEKKEEQKSLKKHVAAEERQIATQPLSEEAFSKPILTPERQKELNKQFKNAVWFGKADDVQRLARLGADINTKDSDGWTALHWAARYKQTETCRVLVNEFGADVNTKDSDGETPLHYAARNGSSETCRVLKELGADINAKSEDGWTPLHLAAYWNKTETCKVLFGRGANPLLKDNDGETARNLISNPEIKKLLEKYENVWKLIGEKKINELFGAIKECSPEKVREMIENL